MRSTALAVAGLLLVAGACSPPDDPSPGGVGAAAVGLERFDSCDELIDHIRSEALEIVGPYGLGGGLVTMDLATGAPVTGRAEAAADAAGAPVAADFSGTNVQEAGVDEPDLVKTDGTRILALARNRLHHISLAGGTPVLTDSLDLPAGWGHNLLLSGDRALVFLSPEAHGVPAPGMSRIGMRGRVMSDRIPSCRTG